MPTVSEPITVRVGPQGRLIIPASLRKLLEINVGDTLVAHSEAGRLILEKPDVVVARLHDRFRVIPPTVSLADELIADRREEARQADR